MSGPAPAPGRALPLAVALLGAGVFVNVYATQALLPELSREFGVGEVEASATVGATTLAMALCSPLVGVLADATGRKRVIVAALLLLALPCLLIAASRDFAHLVAWRFAQGLFVPGVAVVVTAYVAEELPPARVPATLAALVAGNVVGGFLGRFLTGIVADAAGWRAAFALLAALNVLSALVALVALPRARRFRPQPVSGALAGLAEHVRNPRLRATFLVGAGLLFSLVGVFTPVNYHLAAPPYRLPSAALGAVFAVYLLGVVLTPLAGRAIAALGPRTVLVLALTASALGFLLTLAAPLPLIVAGLAVGSCGIFVAQAAATGTVARSAERARSLASGLYNAAYYAGGAVGAVVAGFVYGRLGWEGAVGAVVLALALTALVGWRGWRPAPHAP